MGFYLYFLLLFKKKKFCCLSWISQCRANFVQKDLDFRNLFDKKPDLDNVINNEWENRRREFYSFNFKIDLFSILVEGKKSSGIAN